MIDQYYSTNLNNPKVGQLVWDSHSGSLLVYTGSDWTLVPSGSKLLQVEIRKSKLDRLFNKLI